MSRLRALCFGLLLFAGPCFADSTSDSLRTADSLKAALPLWSDSSLTVADSLGGGHGAAERWLVPLGVMLLTGASAWLLFSTRSK